MMSQFLQEQSKCNPTFGSSSRHCMVTLHNSEYWKAFEFLEAILCNLKRPDLSLELLFIE